jgi:hypothetical protein
MGHKDIERSLMNKLRKLTKMHKEREAERKNEREQGRELW